MEVKITVLAENTVPLSVGHIGEHGLSFLIEAGERKILFDTGQGMALPHNAARMGVDLKAVDTVVLSHGHYDHTGGLKALIDAGARFELIAHPDVFEEKVALHPAHGTIPIGMSLKRDALDAMGIRVRTTRESVQIEQGIRTTGEIPMRTEYEKIEPMLMVRREGKDGPDPLQDDLAMVIEADEGTVVLLGCAHHGVVNTLMRVEELTGKAGVHTLIGGMHLERAPEAQIEKTAAALKERGVRRVSANHCTGPRAAAALSREFGNGFTNCGVGNVIKFHIA